MSTRLGWAGWGKGEGGEDSASRAQASPGLCSMGSHCEPPLLIPLSAFCLPSTHLASMKLRLIGVWQAGLYLDKEPSLWELNTSTFFRAPPSYLWESGREWGSLWGVGVWAGLRSADFLGWRIGWRNEGVYR